LESIVGVGLVFVGVAFDLCFLFIFFFVFPLVGSCTPVDGSLLHVPAFRAGAFGWNRVHDRYPSLDELVFTPSPFLGRGVPSTASILCLSYSVFLPASS
jgi:hypothetical protein